MTGLVLTLCLAVNGTPLSDRPTQVTLTARAALMAEQAQLLENPPRYGGARGPALQLSVGGALLALGAAVIIGGFASNAGLDYTTPGLIIGMTVGPALALGGLITSIAGLVRTVLVAADKVTHADRLAEIDRALHRLDAPVQ